MPKRSHAARQAAAPKVPTATAPAAQALAKRERRASACLDEVNKALAKHGCIILPRVMIVGKELSADWGIRPLDV